MQKYHIGDVVMLNDKKLVHQDRHEQLSPGMTGVVKSSYLCDDRHFRYEIKWDSPDVFLNRGWWVYESCLDPVLPIDPINLEDLL